MFYALDDKGEPQLLDTKNRRAFLEAAQAFGDMANRRVAETARDGVSVSTVFLMIDHKFEMQGSPVLWETMIFGGPLDGYQERARSLEEAILRHRVAVRTAFPTSPPATVWGTLPTLQPDGTIAQEKVEVVVGPSFWDRILRDEDLV